mmetsp:Transcript_3649/g.11244  ORF Transcript_3649/g.11244 Transcript_3649/m.11244 type:complete len:237 (-) Transcript_3649:16-726(-)
MASPQRLTSSLLASSIDLLSLSSFSEVSSLCVKSFTLVSIVADSFACFSIAAFIAVAFSSIDLIFASFSPISFIFSPFTSVNRSISLSKSSISSLHFSFQVVASTLYASKSALVAACFFSNSFFASSTSVFNFVFIVSNSSRSRDTSSMDFFKFSISICFSSTTLESASPSTPSALFPFFDGGIGSPVSTSFSSSFSSRASSFSSFFSFTISFSGDARFFGATLFSPFFNRCFGVP